MSVADLIRDFLIAHKTLAKLLKIPYLLNPAGIPIILAPSGSIGNNGAITLGSALPATYANCYLYLPANAIFAGSTAGLYYTVMTSTTVGTVYNNTYTSGTPVIPSSPTAFVTTGPGAYTQTTATDITLSNVTCPGGTLGKNGAFQILANYVYTNNANAKTRKVLLNATAVSNSAPTTTAMYPLRYLMQNKGSEAVNIDTEGGFSASSASPGRRTIDTSTDFTIKHTGQLAVATDYLILENNMIEIFPAD